MKNKVKDLRKKRGWTQGELGEKLSISRQSVHSIETGKYDPSLPLAFRITDGEPVVVADQRHPEDQRFFGEAFRAAGLSDDEAWLVKYLFSEVMDGRNESLADGVQRALGREPRDFADFARRTAPVWSA